MKHPAYISLKFKPLYKTSLTTLGMCLLGISGLSLQAANEALWTPTNGTNWSTEANWTNVTGSVTPYNLSAGNYVLQFGATGGTSYNDFAADYLVGSIIFNSGAAASTLTGNRITLATAPSPADGRGFITNNSGNDQQIDLDINLSTSGNRSVSSTGGKTLIFTGNMTGLGTFYITSGNVTFLGELSNTGGAYRTNDTYLRLLNPNNSFTADARAAAGILSTNNIANKGLNSSLGKGSTINLGQNWSRGASIGTLQLTNETNSKTGFVGNASSGSTDRTVNISNGLSTAGAGNLASIGNWGGAAIENTVAGQTATFNGNVTSSNRSIQSSFWMLGAGNGRINGYIANGTVSAGTPNQDNSSKTDVTKAGTGTWELNSSNVYSGTTYVYDGVLKIGNSKALGSGGYTTAGTYGGTVVSSGVTRNVTSNAGASLVTNAASAGTLDLNGQTNVNEVFNIKGAGFGGQGALVNNSTTAASIGNGIAAITLTSTANNSAVPTITITGGGGSGATAVATLGVTAESFNLTNGGSGYVDATNSYATLGIGGGSGATAKVIMNSSGVVTGIEILSMGTGFSDSTAATITVNDASAVTETKAAFTVVAGKYGAEIAVTNAGSGYTSAPTVTVNGGANVAVAHLSSVNLDAAASVGGSGDLIVNAVVSSSNSSADMTKVGTGTFVLNAVNTYTSKTIVDGGTLQVGTAGVGTSGTGNVTIKSGSTLAGTGLVKGFTEVSGTVRPGDNAGSSIGTLRFNGLGNASDDGLMLLSGGSASAPRALFTLSGATGNAANPENGIAGDSLLKGTGNHDKIEIEGNLLIETGSTIKVELASYNPIIGDVFNLFDWTGLLDNWGFSLANDLILPNLTAGRWETNQFLSDGIIYVVVPEPSRALLLCAGISAFLLHRRRKLS